MKKFLALTLALLFTFLCIPFYTHTANADAQIWDGSIADGFNGGDGSKENPYEIATGAQLALLAKETISAPIGEFAYQGVYFKQTQDIILNDVSNIADWKNQPPKNEWTAIGKGVYIDEESFDKPFAGNFDGNGFTISGMYVNDDSTQGGLFGIIDCGSLKNITLADSLVVSGAESWLYTAGIVADVRNSRVENCINKADVSSVHFAGGVVGQSRFGSTILNCSNYGNITAVGTDGYSSAAAGGVIMSGSETTVENCNNYGIVESSGRASGIMTIASGDVIIKSCNNYGTISGHNFVGGICAESDLLKIAFCSNEANISAKIQYAGGIVGQSNRTEIYMCQNSGDVTAQSYVGGIAGKGSAAFDDGDSVISRCKNSGNVVATESYVGGICGVCIANTAPFTISDCYNTGEVTMQANDGTEGGIVALLQQDNTEARVTVINCYNVGKTSSVYTSISAHDYYCSIKECYFLAEEEPEEEYFGTALNEEQMRDSASFVGFDFEKVWIMDETTEYPYPELRPDNSMPSPKPDMGDVNFDGTVNAADAVLVLRHCVELITLDEQQLEVADLIEDGIVNTGDAVAILRKCVGLDY